MIYAPTNRRIIRPYDKPSFEHTQRYGLIKGHPLGPAGSLVFFPLLNEGSGDKVYDSSGNGNHGTLSGSAPWEAGKFGFCPHYDGSSGRYKIAYSPELYCGNYMTVSFWAKSDITNYAANAYVVSMYDHAGDKRVWGIRINAATDKWSVITSDDGTSGHTANDDSILSVDTNWHHFCFVVNNSIATWYFYLDGVLYDTLVVNTYTNKLSWITIGGLDAGSWFDGMIDLPTIYNRALSSSEIALLYSQPFCMVEREISPAYFFIAAGEGEVYQELNLTVSADASASESDSQQMVDTGKAVSADASVSKIDTQQMVETGRAVEAAASISCTDLKVVFELNLEVTASGSAVATDAHTMIETGKSVTAIATPAVIDTQTMVEIDLDVSAEGSVSCTDTMGLLAHIAAFMILRQCTT